MAGRFSNAFPTFGAKGVDPAKWREHFVPYDGAAWDAEGDGLLQFEAESGHRYSLLIIHDVPLGFLLLFTASE
ncbi:MAG TPA: hypothetical protein VGE52_19540, partial [Pirellulales bacterium]